MTLKTLTTALALTILPTLGFAMCTGSYGHSDQQAMSCADGTMFDADTQTCIPVVTG